MRVADHRVHLLRRMPGVTITLQSRLNAADVLASGFRRVFVATGSAWRRDGLGRRHREPVAEQGTANVFSPDDVFSGAPIASPVVIYDDDHYVMGGALAERFARDGLVVHLVTPATKVSEWTDMTMEQPRIQARLMDLGVQLQTAVELTGVRASGGGLALSLSSIYAPRPSALECASLVMVTMRDPCDGLVRSLLARQAEWRDAGVASVHCLGDANAPGTVAAAVYAGHRAAREFDAEGKDLDAVPFRRELIAIER
jgi:dimethylamine/trimethylamine dehydrogenase